MKTRSKLLLAAVSLLTVSVAATATSAYAWYTANRQVQASVTQMGVSSTTGNLTIARPTDAVDSFSLIEGQASVNNPIYQTPNEQIPNYTGKLTGVALTDVSSKGLGDFAKPKFNAKGDAIVGNYSVTKNQTSPNKGGDTVTIAKKYVNENSSKEVKAYGVVTMAFEIKNVATANPNADDLNVYIKNASFSTGDQGTSNKTNVINAARFSIIDLAETNPTKPYLYCNPTGTETLKYYDSAKKTEKYLSNDTVVKNVSDTDTEEAKTEAAQAAQAAKEEQGKDKCKWIQDQNTGKLFVSEHPDVTSPNDTNNTKSNGFLCTISANKSHKFLLTMWIEGTDPDCKLGDVNSDDDADISLETNLSLNISLYALNSAKKTTTTTTPDQGAGAGA